MDRLVVVLLRRRDVVLETARHRSPRRVSDAKNSIAVVDRFADDAEGEDVGKLLEADLLVGHLAPDGIGLLLSPRHFRVDAYLGELGGQSGADFLDEALI